MEDAVARCGFCHEELLPRRGRALISCGTCGQEVHLRCYQAYPQRERCIYCREPMDNEAPVHPHDDRFFYVEVGNGELEGRVLRIAADEALEDTVANLMCKVADEIEHQAGDGSELYYELQEDPSRVEISMTAEPWQPLDVLAQLPRDVTQVVARIREDGWQDDMMELKKKPEIHRRMMELSEAMDINDRDFSFSPEFGVALRLIKRMALEWTRGPGADNDENDEGGDDGNLADLLQVLGPATDWGGPRTASTLLRKLRYEFEADL